MIIKARKAREYLGQIQKLDIKVGQRISELNQMRLRLSFISGIDYSKDRIQVMHESGNKQIEELVDCEREILEMIKTETEKKHKVIGEIQRLDNPIYADILFRRYVECRSFERISGDMGYAYNYVCNMHGKALEAFQEQIMEADEVVK